MGVTPYNTDLTLSDAEIDAKIAQHTPPKSGMHVITEGHIFGPNENYPDQGYPGYIDKDGRGIIADLDLYELRQSTPNITIDDVCSAFGITKQELAAVNGNNLKHTDILHIPLTQNSFKAMAHWGMTSRMNPPFSDARDFTNIPIANIPEGINETYDIPQATYYDYQSIGPAIGPYYTVPTITHTAARRRAASKSKKKQPHLTSGPRRMVYHFGDKLVDFLRPLQTGSMSAGMPVYRWDTE